MKSCHLFQSGAAEVRLPHLYGPRQHGEAEILRQHFGESEAGGENPSCGAFS